MNWYRKYLKIYDKPLGQIPPNIIEVLKVKIQTINSSNPLASIVIIAHNEEMHLTSCIWSLIDNVYDFPIELIVINNNSTDNTEEILKQLNVTYYNEFQKGPGYARQCGLNRAKGIYHLCIDADTIYPPHYIETHIKQLKKKGIVCTYSLWNFMPDKRHPRVSLWFYEIIRNLYLVLQSIRRPELCVRGMTFGFNTEVARQFGFRTDIIRGEDGSLALAMKPFGKFKFIKSNKATVLTSNSTLNMEGGIIKNIWRRLIKIKKNGITIFVKKETYQDEDNNLMK